MANSHTRSTIVADGFYASGTSNLSTANATVIPAGAIRCAGALRSGTTLTVGTTITAGTGFVFSSGHTKQFASGTYIGTGGATAAIVSTGLTTITHVFMQLNKAAYSSATTGMAYGRPCVAAGTPGSFYPIAFKVSGAPGPVLNTVAGTFRWLAIGADTL